MRTSCLLLRKNQSSSSRCLHGNLSGFKTSGAEAVCSVLSNVYHGNLTLSLIGLTPVERKPFAGT